MSNWRRHTHRPTGSQTHIHTGTQTLPVFFLETITIHFVNGMYTYKILTEKVIIRLNDFDSSMAVYVIC